MTWKWTSEPIKVRQMTYDGRLVKIQNRTKEKVWKNECIAGIVALKSMETENIREKVYCKTGSSTRLTEAILSSPQSAVNFEYVGGPYLY
jgi:hypothetical protein